MKISVQLKKQQHQNKKVQTDTTALQPLYAHLLQLVITVCINEILLVYKL